MTAAAAKRWLLYGANGYTGELIAREAARLGLKPILAGRSRAVEKLASELNLQSAVFALHDHTAMLSSLEGISAVLNCAGPFSSTAAVLMQACMASHAHYFDITGEIDVFERAHALDAQAQRAGVLLCPGVGFDVVPTDCIAATLKAALPDATQLALGFESSGGLSRGTARTMVESIAGGARVRRNGHIESLPHGALSRRIDFGNGERLGVAIAWGDVSTAYYSTGIGHIDVFIASSDSQLRRLRSLNRWRALARYRIVQYFMKRAAKRGGPSETERSGQPTYVWGEAIAPNGARKTARVRTPNGYQTTIYAALGIVHDTLESGSAIGFKTPSQLMGASYVSQLPGAGAIEVA